MTDCMDCGQPIDPDAFPDFADTENVVRCAECTVLVLWRLVTESWVHNQKLLKTLDRLDELCSVCGQPWLVTETILPDGSLGCPCQNDN